MGRGKNIKLKEKEKRARINNTLLKEGVACHRNGNLKKAEDLYQKILVSNPNHVEALRFYGLLTHQNGDYETAVTLVDRAIIVKPADATLYVNKGVSLKMLGKREEAVDCYRAAVELDPENAEAYRNLGTVLKDMDDFDGALSSFRRAAELNSAYMGALASMRKFMEEKRKVALEIKQLLEAEDSISATSDNVAGEDPGRTSRPISVERKICGKCEEEKPADDFHRNKYTRDGLKAACKECVNRQAREYRKKVRERLNRDKTSVGA